MTLSNAPRLAGAGGAPSHRGACVAQRGALAVSARHLQRRVWPCLIALAFALACAASAFAAPSGVKVGFVCPLTGGSADFGNSARQGIELAVKEMNEVGGFLGRPYELIIRDDKASPEEGRKHAEDLVLREKVAFTVGFCNTGVALRALDVFQDHRSVLLIPVATGTALTARYPAASSYIFRMSARDALQAPFLIDEVARRGLTRVAIIADTTGYGDGGLRDLQEAITRKGLSLVYTARFDIGVSSLAPNVAAAKAAGAEAIVAYSLGPELAVFARARREAGFSGPVFGPWPASFRTVWHRSEGAAEGLMMPQTFINDALLERRASFAARLARHAQGQPIASIAAAAQAYDSMHILVRTMFKTRGDISGPALKAALESLDRPYQGVITTYEQPFSSADHDAISANMIWLGIWRNGEVKFAYPEDAKRSAIVRRKQ